MTDDLDHIWTAVQHELRQAVPADMYDVWLAPAAGGRARGRRPRRRGPAELRAWVAERFARVLQASVAAVLGPEVTVDVRSGASASRGLGRARSTQPAPADGAAQATPRGPTTASTRG